MIFLISIPSFLVFLFSLYRVSREDHVFLRKNVKLEQIFDIALIISIVATLTTQAFSPTGNYSLSYAVLSGSLGLILIGKYKKLPLGRLFDFFTISFLTSLPAYYLLIALIMKRAEAFIYLFDSVTYLILAVFFIRGLLARVMNRSLKEGFLSIFFTIIFSLLSFLTSLVIAIQTHGKFNFLSLENIALLILFIVSLVLLVKQSREKS